MFLGGFPALAKKDPRIVSPSATQVTADPGAATDALLIRSECGAGERCRKVQTKIE
jgi:hypothetical protein